MLAKTGVHHLNGTIHLEKMREHRLAHLVAHHGSGAVETTLRWFVGEFVQLPRESSLVADALTYCDLSCGADGTRLSLDERPREIRACYRDHHIVIRELDATDHVIRGAFRRIELRLVNVESHVATQTITESRRGAPK
jgi:hypothetical protein